MILKRAETAVKAGNAAGRNPLFSKVKKEKPEATILSCGVHSLTRSGSPTARGRKSRLDCSFASMSFCRWMGDARDYAARWRVLFMDKWTGESACAYRSLEEEEEEGSLDPSGSQTAVAKLWSPYVKASRVQCLRFRFRFESGGQLSVLKHKKG